MARSLRKLDCWRGGLRIPPKRLKALVQSALESDADSSSDDSPGFDRSSSGESEEEDSDDFFEEVPAPERNPKANDGVRAPRAQLLPVHRTKSKEPFPRARKQRLLLVRQTTAANRSRGEPPRRPARRRHSVVDMLSTVVPHLITMVPQLVIQH